MSATPSSTGVEEPGAAAGVVPVLAAATATEEFGLVPLQPATSRASASAAPGRIVFMGDLLRSPLDHGPCRARAMAIKSRRPRELRGPAWVARRLAKLRLDEA